ncbi:MAG: hypothetical protein GY798_23710 [Hyphomicrobiales bacterium]|nr:hypothetical protein [Hyphomicrobiales bacterium]
MKRLCLALLVAVAAAAPAHAWWGGKGHLPACDSRQVVSSIVQKFAYANRVTFHWGVGVESITEIYEKPEQIRSDSNIGRRYCRGTAWLTDGRSSEVVYLIESRQGFASIGWRVQSCLPAFDEWHVYGSWCRSIRP